MAPVGGRTNKRALEEPSGENPLGQRADGFSRARPSVSTPTGSTGYSLSCGGPIIFPQANSFVITPVAPHNLNVRPIIISDASVVSFEVEGRAEHFLCTLDARSESIDSSVSLAVRKEDFTIQLIRLEGQHFLQTLQTKLYWGADRRN